MAAPSYVAQGTAQLVTTSAAMPYPAGLAAGDLIILTVSNSASGIGTASGTWTELGTATTGGSMTSRRWYKIATGSETGTETINVTSGVKGIGYMTAYRPATGGNTLTPSLTTGADSSSDTTFNPTGSSWVSATDNMVVVEVIAVAATTFGGIGTSLALTQSGATYAAISNRFAARASSNTLWYAHSDAAVTSGGTGAPAFSATLNGAGTGHVVYIRITETAPAGGSVNAVAATATAAAAAPVWRGGGKVTSVAATASALVKPPLGSGLVSAVRAQATAAASAPTIDPHVTPSYSSAGSVVAVTSSTAAPPYPATVAANDGLLMFVSTNGSAMGAAPAGWTQVGTTQVAGGIRKACFFKRATGTETGTVSVTGLTGGTKGDAYIVRFVRGSSVDVINVTAAGWQDTDATTTTLTGTGASWTSTTAGIIASSHTANAPTTAYSGIATSPTITQAGASVTTTARFAGRTGVAGDNTIAYGFQTGAITSGGTGAPTFTATTVGDNGQGAGFLVLVTETAATNAVVNAVAAPSTAAALAPTVRVSVAAVRATATSAIQPPSVLGDNLAPAFRDSGSAQGSSAITSLTVTRPATVQVGDMGLVIVMAGAGSGAPTAPPGWSTLLANSLTSGGSSGVSAFYRIHQSGDADPTVVWGSAPASGNNTAMLAVWYSGAATISINTPTTSGVASATWSTGTISAGDVNTILAVGAMKAGSGTWASTASWSAPTQMRATRYATGTFYPSIVLGDLIQTTAGTTTAQTVTWNLSTTNAMAFQIDLAPAGVGASVSAVVGTATALANPPSTGSNAIIFPPAATTNIVAPIPVVFAGTGQTGGGPIAASALMVAPGARIRTFLNVRATATAAAIPPPPPGSSNLAVRATASAVAVPPVVTGSGLVSPPAATASASFNPPVMDADVAVQRFLATAAALAPQIGTSTVRPGAMAATALTLAPTIPGHVTATAAVATALMFAPTVRGAGFLLSATAATASAVFIIPRVGRSRYRFRPPHPKIHYKTGDPLMDRIGYPTGSAVLLLDGFYVTVDYPDDEQIAAADAVYLGGRDYYPTDAEVTALTNAGYGGFIDQEVFV